MNPLHKAPPVAPGPGWTPVDPLGIESGRGSFVSGEPDGDRLRIRNFVDPSGRLVGRAWFGPGSLGPPGHAHGGSMAAVLDEAMGAAAWLAGHRVVAVHLESEFRRLLPIGTDATFEAWVERVEGRKIYTRSRLYGATGEDYAAATALFLEIPAALATRLLGALDPKGNETPDL